MLGFLDNATSIRIETIWSLDQLFEIHKNKHLNSEEFHHLNSDFWIKVFDDVRFLGRWVVVDAWNNKHIEEPDR